MGSDALRVVIECELEDREGSDRSIAQQLADIIRSGVIDEWVGR